MKKMKKMKKQFLSLFVLLCMIISMFPTTALAANIDVSGKVTVDRVYEEPKCADNLYYGEVNVNGSATESKTRLTHPVLPLIQWQYGNNTYQIIPSAYKYYVYNINDPNHILEGIEGSEGSSTLSGWPGTYKCYQTVVTTDGVTNGTATFDIDLIYQFSRLNSSIGWTYASNWGGRTLHFTIKQTVAYTVTYTDGVEDEEVFADEVHENLSSGVATPAFSGGTPTRTGYVFKGWNPEVAATVTGNATYVATWGEDKNNNGIDDNEETKYTVTYTDGVDGEEVFADQVYGNLLSGVATPAFEGTPTREGYVFKGWNPEVATTVTGNVTYVATWGEDKNNNGIDDNEETKYTVTYTDGVDGEVFADQVYGNLLSGVATPAFEGTPTRTGYVFKGWNPAVAATVTGNATYVARWGEDKNNNGIADDEETKYTVRYTDGVDEEVIFADQVYGNLLSGVDTPAFKGTPKREGYVFKDWNPSVAEKVTGDVTYVATWGKDKNNNGIDDNEETKYTVTYTDGVDGEVFADQVYGNLLSGVATPAFEGTPTREEYVFKGWEPAVAEKVTGDATYAATWGEDKNNNGIDDNEETKYTVTYTDGVDGEVFADQVYGNLLSGVATPAFEGTPTREGYVFKGWKPAVAEKVTGDVTYVATWGEDKNNNGIADDEETKYTVRYTDGVDEEVIFADQVYGNLLSGVDTPAFKGTPTREGYVFKGWKPAVAEKVTGDVTYVAVWEKAKDNNGDTKPGDTKPGDTKPGNTKPGNTKPNTTTNSSTKAGTSARSPKTSDTANLALWMALLVVSGGSMVINKKKKYNR